jgi:hypothetical protein
MRNLLIAATAALVGIGCSNSGHAGADSGGGQGGAGGTGGEHGGTGGTGGEHSGTGGSGGSSDAPVGAGLSFFVTSDTAADGNLGGLDAADSRCGTLAAAVGAGARTWHAYLSVEHGADGGAPINARDRIGSGPWVNANGVTVASDLDTLHQRFGDPEVFIDEHGGKINGQWTGSPTPNQHDVLTGSMRDGTLLAGTTCGDWTSTTGNAQVGHTDGLGPGGVTMNGTTDYRPWNSVHTSPCNNLPSTGGAGKLYCFAVN